MIVYLYKLLFFNTPLAPMLLTSRWVSRQKDVKQLSINKSKLTVEVKHPSATEQRYFPNSHFEKEETCLPFLYFDMVRNELNRN